MCDFLNHLVCKSSARTEQSWFTVTTWKKAQKSGQKKDLAKNKKKQNLNPWFGNILTTGEMMYQSKYICKTCQTTAVGKQSRGH